MKAFLVTTFVFTFQLGHGRQPVDIPPFCSTIKFTIVFQGFMLLNEIDTKAGIKTMNLYFPKGEQEHIHKAELIISKGRLEYSGTRTLRLDDVKLDINAMSPGEPHTRSLGLVHPLWTTDGRIPQVKSIDLIDKYLNCVMSMAGGAWSVFDEERLDRYHMAEYEGHGSAASSVKWVNYLVREVEPPAKIGIKLISFGSKSEKVDYLIPDANGEVELIIINEPVNSVAQRQIVDGGYEEVTHWNYFSHLLDPVKGVGTLQIKVPRRLPYPTTCAATRRDERLASGALCPPGKLP